MYCAAEYTVAQKTSHCFEGQHVVYETCTISVRGRTLQGSIPEPAHFISVIWGANERASELPPQRESLSTEDTGVNFNADTRVKVK